MDPSQKTLFISLLCILVNNNNVIFLSLDSLLQKKIYDTKILLDLGSL